MRKLVVWVMTLGVAVLLALPASAKGIDYAHFTGPGLPAGGVTIHGEHQVLWQTGLLQPKSPSFSVYGLSRSDLGQPFKADYHMDYAPRLALHQVIYPYAKGGMMTFTPRGQHLGQDYESFRGGWKRGSPQLLAFLVAHGFPRQAPGTETAAKPVTAATSTVQGISDASERGWLWAIVVVAVLVLVAGGTLATRRIRGVR